MRYVLESTDKNSRLCLRLLHIITITTDTAQWARNMYKPQAHEKDDHPNRWKQDSEATKLTSRPINAWNLQTVKNANWLKPIEVICMHDNNTNKWTINTRWQWQCFSTCTHTHTHTHTHKHTYLNIISTGDIQPKTTPNPALTLYDLGIPEHTLLTLHQPQNKAPCKPVTLPVDRYVASLWVKILTNVTSWYEIHLHIHKIPRDHSPGTGQLPQHFPPTPHSIPNHVALPTQEAFEKCWAHSPLRAATRRLFYIAIHRCRYCRTPPAHRCPQQHQWPTTTTTTRDRGDCYGPIEWAQSCS